MSDNTYSSDSIKVLKGLEAVKKRPGMYIGDTDDGTGLHHMVFEVLDNAIDESLAGHCDDIKVIIHPDNSITVTDNGRGIPTEIKEDDEEKRSAAEIVMTELHAGGKFDQNSYKVSGGLHGVGVSVVNALSEWMWVEVKRDGKVHRQEYKIGEPQTDLKTVGTAKKTGTKVCFYPDNNIFKTIGFEYDIISERLRELAYLNKGIEIQLKDERSEDGESDVFKFKGGLSDFVKYLDEHNNPLHNKIITVNREDGEVPVEVALRYGNTYNDNILTFVNNINTIEGGTHLSGFRSALTRAMNNHASKNNLIKAKKNEKQPIVFYGTSITQGGCASRPGMAHTNIISRKLDLDVVNFGFSGNGRMEQPIGELISNADAKLYIIECLPNMISPENITQRTIPLVNTIRKNNPFAPIVLIDLFKTPRSILNSDSKRYTKAMDEALKSEFEKMIDLGYKNLYYIETPKIIDSDNEGTVDAIHFTDLGFLRYADFLIDSLSRLELLD